jgi:hypothetical protein
MQHHTHTTGDIAVIATTLDLTEKGWVVYRPVSAEFLPYDLVASKKLPDGTMAFRTFQVKSFDVAIHTKYAPKEFDYFALYLKSKKIVVYLSLDFVKKHTTSTLQITSEIPNSPAKFWWYEDFLTPSLKDRSKRSLGDFGIKLDVKKRVTQRVLEYREEIHNKRAIRVSDTQLKRLVWKKPLRDVAKDFGVSDVAVKKECQKRGIETPERGYWLRRGKE